MIMELSACGALPNVIEGTLSINQKMVTRSSGNNFEIPGVTELEATRS